VKTPSPSLVVSCVALAVALGGTAYAVTALPKNSVGSAQIKKNAVTGAKIKAGSIDATDLRPGVLLSGAPAAKGDTGSTGAKGVAGNTGAAGPSGITTTSAASNSDVQGVVGTSATVLKLGPAGTSSARQSAGTITVSTASTLIINASVVLLTTGVGSHEVACFLIVDDTALGNQWGPYGAWAQWSAYNNARNTLPLVGSRTVAAGTHDVEVSCMSLTPFVGTTSYLEGALTVVAATAPPA